MNSEKHILFMVGATYVAGAEITNFNLIRDMHQQGYKILVVVSGWNDGDFINRLNQFNIPYKAIKLGWFFIKNPSWVLDSLIHYPKAFWQLRKILKEFKPVWIFHYSYRNFLSGYPLFRKHKNIYREHDEPLTHFLNRRIYLFLNKNCKAIICPTTDIKNKLIKLKVNANVIHIIPSPLDPELITHSNNFYKNRNEIVQIGMVGQIISRKGFDFIFDILKQINLPFKLNIYGNDNTIYAQSIKNKIEPVLREKIEWHGLIKDRIQIFQNLDFVLYPSLSESFGRIVIEAAVFNIPVIASNLECFNDNIIHRETGLIFNLYNKIELKQSIEDLIINTKLREELGKNARNFVLANFTSEKCTEKFKKIIYE